MTFEYIAGFFDGEGNISRSLEKRVPCASMSQARAKVLYDIKEFLARHNIKSQVCRIREQQGNWNECSELNITSREQVVRFLRAVRPFLIVKLVEAERALHFIKVTQWYFTKPSETRLKIARKAYHEGLSFRDVERKYGLDSHTIRNYMKRFGERGRPQRSAIKDYWSKKMSTNG